MGIQSKWLAARVYYKDTKGSLQAIQAAVESFLEIVPEDGDENLPTEEKLHRDHLRFDQTGEIAEAIQDAKNEASKLSNAVDNCEPRSIFDPRIYKQSWAGVRAGADEILESLQRFGITVNEWHGIFAENLFPANGRQRVQDLLEDIKDLLSDSSTAFKPLKFKANTKVSGSRK